MLNVYKKRVIGNACLMVNFCISAINTCAKRHLISLKYKGYAIAYSLQNPYVALIPKLGVQLRVSNNLN